MAMIQGKPSWHCCQQGKKPCRTPVCACTPPPSAASSGPSTSTSAVRPGSCTDSKVILVEKTLDGGNQSINQSI